MRLAKRPQPIHLKPGGSPWLTVQQVADYLGVGKETIYAACAAKALKHARFGRSTIRLRLEWVDAWAESLAE